MCGGERGEGEGVEVFPEKCVMCKVIRELLLFCTSTVAVVLGKNKNKTKIKNNNIEIHLYMSAIFMTLFAAGGLFFSKPKHVERNF